MLTIHGFPSITPSVTYHEAKVANDVALDDVSILREELAQLIDARSRSKVANEDLRAILQTSGHRDESFFEDSRLTQLVKLFSFGTEKCQMKTPVVPHDLTKVLRNKHQRVSDRPLVPAKDLRRSGRTLKSIPYRRQGVSLTSCDATQNRPTCKTRAS
jgi:hypothetical protein